MIGNVLALTMISWEALCNGMHMHMTNLKLHVLGLQRTAQVCRALTGIMVCGLALFFAIDLVHFGFGEVEGDHSYMAPANVLCDNPSWIIFWVIGVASTVLVSLLQFLGLCFAAGRAMGFGWHNADIRHATYLLYVNSMLQPLGPIISMWAVLGYLSFREADLALSESDLSRLTLDICFQVLSVLLLSGLVGPQQWQDPMSAFQQLATLQGFGLVAKRVAFSGHVNENAQDCIVSFPGKYSEQWDQAVSAAKTQEVFSLACVFLTDRASGLGVHCDNPDDPGECWCRAIYGHLPASTFISVIDMRPEMQNSQAPIDLDFKRADAVAMGQRLATWFESPVNSNLFALKA